MDLTIANDYRTERLSLYRTDNVLAGYGELRDAAQLPALAALREARGEELFVVGNGSNLFLARPRIESVVVKNCLPRVIERRGGEEVWVSGTANVMEMLRFCFREGLDSFYYLASVPATIGGALAMNAGRGRASGTTIYDFVRRVRYYDLEKRETVEISGADAVRGYRRTIFTGPTSKVVLEAAFVFPPRSFGENPIEARKAYAASQQDYSGPNCGSVFKDYNRRVLRLTQRVGLHYAGARFSRRTLNWIVNDSPRPRGIATVVRTVELLHRALGRRIEREIITVR